MPGVTPNMGIRYPLMTEAPDPGAVAAMAFDMETAATSIDALRTTALTQRGAMVLKSTTTSVAKGTAVKHTFDTEVFDVQGWVNLGTNNDRIVVDKAGLYLFGASYSMDDAGNFGSALNVTSVEITIAKNVTASANLLVPNIRRRKYPGYQNTSIGGNAYLVTTGPFVMAATDFVTMWMWWNGTGAGPGTVRNPTMWATCLALT